MSSPLPRKRVVLLGATGSIGESTLRVIAAHSDRLELVAIAARSNWRKLADTARRFGVRHVGLFEQEAYVQGASTPEAFLPGTRFYAGIEGLNELAALPEADIVLVAVVGTTGLRPALTALACGKSLALASKEILVLAGKFVMESARAHKAALLPVDSEHNAVFQCIEGHSNASVARIILTASGGAFRDWSADQLVNATPADALRHPNWSMGPKITVDSATLANKGLELIEAQWLFNLKPEQCQAVIHKQSIVHCLVEFTDGAMLAQLCPPSMTFPIQHALLHPERPKGTDQSLDLTKAFSLDFRPVEHAHYPMLDLALACMRKGGTAPAVYNAANEIAVSAFLEERIPFLGIPRLVEATLVKCPHTDPSSLDEVLALDTQARTLARELMKKEEGRM